MSTNAEWKHAIIGVGTAVDNYDANGDLTEVKRAFAAAIRGSSCYEAFSKLSELASDFEVVESEGGFNDVSTRFYDFCDEARIWVEPGRSG